MKLTKLVILFAAIIASLVFLKYSKNNGEFNHYACNTRSCNKNTCASAGTVNFKINREQGFVNANFYIYNGFSGSRTLENCNIIDDNNWVCINNFEEEDFKLHEEVQMSPGEYRWIQQEGKSSEFSCGNKRSIFDISNNDG